MPIAAAKNAELQAMIFSRPTVSTDPLPAHYCAD